MTHFNSSHIAIFALAAIFGLAGGISGATASGPSFKPTVIGGAPSPALAGAAVALETEAGYFCTGSLWRSRIIATAAHCLEDAEGNAVQASEIHVWAPGAYTNGPYSEAIVTDVVMDVNWSTYAEDSEESTGRDFALLIVDRPLGSSAWTRMATPMEVATLTWNSARVEFVGYGTTTPRVDPNGAVSVVPYGLSKKLTWGYNSDLGSFKVPGNKTSGTCGGDSGGPWMSRVGNEILYVGPLSGGQGLPCDKPKPLADTYDDGAVASANTDVISVALATAGESPDRNPKTCMQGDDIKKTCFEGRAWEYDYCWSAKKSQLWKWGKGKQWKRVDSYTGWKDKNCSSKYPYRTTYRQIEATKNSWYEVYFPKQTGSSEEVSDTFRAQVTGP
jgi:hypothetical protein